MNRQRLSLRGLQVACLISATIAIVGGGNFVLAGADGLATVVGFEYPSLSPELEKAAEAIEPAIKVTFDTWYRVLGWYWLMTGVMLLWITPQVQHRSDWFRFIHIGFMAVGIARLITILDGGANMQNRIDAVVIELTVPSLLITWQWFVARAARSELTK